tara:strand:+ start:5086 stop:6300 length:1215 start_codon:yes stop_codon:yes gene_type:complete
MTNLKSVEKSTLKTFKTHRPSEYFSDNESDQSFNVHDEKVEHLYRFGLSLPPEYFKGKRLIDLGAGTGHHTVSLARWGAKCTLLEMNEDALIVAKNLFSEFSNTEDHNFIHSSLYDIDLEKYREKFDIAHSRGVFTHVADKRRAFSILATLAKPGGYIIYGDRNTYGGIQEMLQRLAIYNFAGNDEAKIVEASEKLFSDDIDRSVLSVPRSREAVIYDRWVIRQQDDPSITDVIDFFEQNNLMYVNSWPRIDFLGRGVSTFTDPNNNQALKEGAFLVENLWMILNNGESENIQSFEGEGLHDYKKLLGTVANQLRNLNADTDIDLTSMQQDFKKMKKLSVDAFGKPILITRLDTFFNEVESFIESINNKKTLSELRQELDKYKILFKGYSGVRHVDYIAYKKDL